MKWNLMEKEGRLEVPESFKKKIYNHYERINKVPVVLLDMGVPGLAFARHLGRRNIPIIALDTKAKHWTHYSKYVYTLVSKNFENNKTLLSVLDSISSIFDEKLVLIPLHDDHVKFVSSNRAALEHFYQVLAPDLHVAEALVDKRKLHQLCIKNEVPVPDTIFPDNIEELRSMTDKISFPCLIKPAESRAWQSEQAHIVLAGKKAVKVNNKDELLKTYMQLSKIDKNMIIQDLVQGPDENLYYVVLYVDKTGAIKGDFVGQKLRTYPAHFGRGSYVKSVLNQPVVDLAHKIVKNLNYHGNIGVELKLDERDKKYKLIEINARFGLWDGFASDCDMDLVYAAYNDATGNEFNLSDKYKLNKYWVNFELDYKAALQYYRLGELKPINWLRSVLFSDYSAITANDDLKPAVAFWISTGKYFMQRALSRLVH